VAVVPNGPHVLAITRGFNPKDPSFPGGDSEPTDDTPAETAQRELFEETGIIAQELRAIDQWVGERGQPVFAFFVPQWQGRLRASNEGKPFWTPPQRLLVSTATYSASALRLMEKLGRVRQRRTG